MILRMNRPLANDHPDGPASCKWPSRWTGLLQIIIQMDRPLANDHPDGPVACNWKSGWTALLQMIIQMDRPLANDHPDGPAPCKRSSGWTGSCKWSSGLTRFFSNCLLKHISYFPPTNIIFSCKTFLLLLQILASRSNLADLSRTMCSCLTYKTFFHVYWAILSRFYAFFGLSSQA